MKYVIKRDGRRVPCEEQKIANAIEKAFQEVYEKKEEGTYYDMVIPHTIAKSIINSESEEMTVEEIQNLVEKDLMLSGETEVAKAYILYRNERSRIRERKSKIVKKVFTRIEASNIENMNANVDEQSFSGKEKESSADVQKVLALDYNLTPEISQAHQNMILYQHDLDKANIGEHNCLNIDFSLLKNGFYTKNGDVRGASTFSTACQLIAVIFQCQSQVQFGGVGSVHIDSDLAPFVKMSFRKTFRHYFTDVLDMTDDEVEELLLQYEPIELDNKSLYEKDTEMTKAYWFATKQLEREGRQAAEGLYHNLNTLESRQGSQVPFTSINFGRDTSTEGRLVSKWLMNASLNGIGKLHRTSIFPISIFQWKSEINVKKGDPNYDIKRLALKSMSKRIYPNWVNGDWSQAHEDPNNIDTYFSTMGCRTMIGYDINGLGYQRVGRGNIVPNTMILPQLGIKYGICLGEREKPDIEGFWNGFEELLKLCEKGLLERYDIIKSQSPKSAPFMYGNGTAAGYKDCIDTVEPMVKHGSLAMGYIGLNEMCYAMFGNNFVHDPEILDFAEAVVKRINTYAKEASERNQLNFSCYATPAENLCHTAAEALQKQYGVIEHVTDRSYLTNSHHVPVWEKVSIFEKLEIESRFCKYPTGGCITYVELDSTFVNNLDAIETIVDYAFKKLDIPYLAFNFPIDTCLGCGYQGDIPEGTPCPMCGSLEAERLRRVTGYITVDYSDFNEGKIDEVKDRQKHSLMTTLEEEDSVEALLNK